MTALEIIGMGAVMLGALIVLMYVFKWADEFGKEKRDEDDDEWEEDE